ncbi:hypothetical protein B0O80DRAFT_465588 [Mortierella sp. GBAus27b]|nr:hypothetical protein B0O80DRAFT_465588 [Mortierella sp. GBAus27b]
MLYGWTLYRREEATSRACETSHCKGTTIEVYWRIRKFDIHRERPSIIKGEVVSKSLHPATGSKYDGVWPTTVDNALIIGTRSYDALLTSSIRLDSEHPASVGGLTMSLQLLSSSDSRGTSIFLDAQSVRDAEALMSSTTTSSTDSGEGISELRQVRSHFDEISTFTMCRASGDLARNNLCQPYTVFTFALSEVTATTKAGAIADSFFAIGEAVLSVGSRSQRWKPGTAVSRSCQYSTGAVSGKGN